MASELLRFSKDFVRVCLRCRPFSPRLDRVLIVFEPPEEPQHIKRIPAPILAIFRGELTDRLTLRKLAHTYTS
jgi:hypothetical protein